MLDTLRWLIDIRGRVTAGQYLRAGLLLVVAKLTIDGLLCSFVFPRPWWPLVQLMTVAGGLGRGGVDVGWLVLAAVALPFCAVGVALTIRRLRDADCSPWLAVLFVLPLVNWILFVALVRAASVAPPGPGPRPAAPSPDEAGRAFWRRGDWPVLWANAALVVVIALAIGPLAHYGSALFLGAPFVQGMVAGALGGADGRRALRTWLISIGVVVALLIGLAAEGLFCIVMAAPIWLAFGLLGYLLGRALRRLEGAGVVAGLVVLPLLHTLEPVVSPPASTFEITTDLVVRATPQRVWDRLVTFGAMAPPTEWWFRAGIAYPTHATIEGRGVGAVRRCSFNTGDFVEPIEVWDEPRLLRFGVEQCPQPMIEWNPLHDHVDAAHLHGFFAAKRGQFELLPQADGSTLLRGTTWYAHGLHPEGYWRVWSDWLLHSIHRRVLTHIREQAERH